MSNLTGKRRRPKGFSEAYSKAKDANPVKHIKRQAYDQ